eukprot:5974301-Pyramimonas_sp.AAC.1
MQAATSKGLGGISARGTTTARRLFCLLQSDSEGSKRIARTRNCNRRSVALGPDVGLPDGEAIKA